MRLAGLGAGVCVLGFVLLVLDPSPVAAAGSTPSQDPRPLDVVSEVVAPVARSLGADLSVSDVGVLGSPPSPEGTALAGALDGVVPGSAGPAGDVSTGVTQPLLGTLADAPRAVFGTATATVRSLVDPSAAPGFLAPVPVPVAEAGGEAPVAVPEADPLGAPGEGLGPDLLVSPGGWEGAGETPEGDARPALAGVEGWPSLFGADTFRPAPVPGGVPAVASLVRSALPAGAATVTGSSGDWSGGAHPIAAILAVAVLLVPLLLLLRRSRRRHVWTTPVLLPLVDPD